MLYVDDHIQCLDVAQALQAVGEQRRRYALRYRRELDRRLCLAAYVLLQRALHDEYGIDHVPPFIFGPHGKPMLEGYPHIHFNLSHCRHAAVCAVSDRPIGVDVESIESYDEALVAGTMSADEQRLIALSDDAPATFIKLWTMKESLLKLTGRGITQNVALVLDDASRYVFNTQAHRQFICTTCSHRL